MLITGREDAYYGWFWDNFGVRPRVIDDVTRAAYLSSYSQPDHLRAGLALYLLIPIDEVYARAVASDPLRIPVLALGGADSWGRGTQPIEALSCFAEDVRGRAIPEAGHWLPEEQPHRVVEELRQFFLECGLTAHLHDIRDQ